MYQGKKSSVSSIFICIFSCCDDLSLIFFLYLDHEWKNAFFIQCLTPMLEAMVAVDPPDYSHIISLDKSVRDFGVPELLDDHKAQSISPRFLVMQRGLVAISRELGMSPLHLSVPPKEDYI